MNILLVEDTPSLSMVYEAALTRGGHRVTSVFTARDARATFNADLHNVVLLDMMLPDGNGRDVLAEIKQIAPWTEVIVITSNTSIDVAVDAMRLGASDFLVKPFDEHRLLSAVGAARKPQTPSAPAGEGGTTEIPNGFIGDSAAMKAVYQTVHVVARSSASVFITGESGTGKEVCAQALHAHSNRAEKPFVPLNCGAIPAHLLESEVFGHLKGSFTGAIADKEGAATAADGGTLFLDEICEMDLALQTKLLRFIQSSTVQPVGATRARRVDVRIVCATNRDPAAEVAAGRFREDLYYRLHVVPIHMPPLRDRGEDVNQIAEHMLRVFSAEEGREFSGLAEDVKALFRAAPWRGNVRELLNVLRSAVVLNEGPVLTGAMLPPALRASNAPYDGGASRSGVGAGVSSTDPFVSLVGRALGDVERSFIEATIDHCGGSIPRAARMLEISPSTLYRKRDSWLKEAAS
ncbi:sigma-54-dependent transcriptional regulator [Pontivivens insulae]|uniref:Nif-specific regulatory protein n=1 Tax=Pontivivens insulae TaxID=1639689 RepID=A0A2R8ADQ3_9RHOB|nr:sigma-54 dependent transcriptional regulator [Pontivivens insulae]RED14274.1 two component Fis family sigma54 specific transcriptional regulator [Pontivivens insulae]SPF30349.1 Luminescence regulatory protein LuxO [Pontivivens insulae]